jgi:hypothetical protein
MSKSPNQPLHSDVNTHANQASQSGVARESREARPATQGAAMNENNPKSQLDKSTQSKSGINEPANKDTQRHREVRTSDATGTGDRLNDRGSNRDAAHARDNASKDQQADSSNKVFGQTSARAYEIYEDRVRTGKQGCCNSDWAQAERDGAQTEERGVDRAQEVQVADAGESVYGAHLSASRLRVQD